LLLTLYFHIFIRKTTQLIRNKIENVFIKANYTGYFTSDNEPDGIENAKDAETPYEIWNLLCAVFKIIVVSTNKYLENIHPN
jgi:hypothetical protein